MDCVATDERYTSLMNAAARAAKSVTTILDPDLLLHRTVDIIRDELGPYHASVFLLDASGRWAVLQVASGQKGTAKQQLAMDGNTAISAAIKQHRIQTMHTADAPVILGIPGLPPTPAAIVLPLEIGDEAIGALLVQGDEPDAFGQAERTTLQIIADQLAIAINNSRLHRQIQELIHQSVRRARLLGAANAVGHSVATIPDLDELLPKTVDTICETFGFYYAGVFLLDKSGQWAVLRAGRGEAGAAMVAEGHKLRVGEGSMIGTAISQRQARIALDVDQEIDFSSHPHLPHTRSEMALPLILGDKMLGAVTVQSVEGRAFSQDDVTSLQTMADYLAIAIHNAQVLQELETANAELVRSKTFEAIATATGQTIHWVGNKAAPIPGSVERISQDLTRYLGMAEALLSQAPPDLRAHKFAQMLSEAGQTIAAHGADLAEIQSTLERQSLQRLRRSLSIESIFEDLHIIETGADAILNIKEDLMGPARQGKVERIFLPELLRETIASMGIPPAIVRTVWEDNLPLVRADREQLDRVFINLIKNAMEALELVKDKKLLIRARSVHESGRVEIDVVDNGSGIPPDQIDKIWMAFYTTKGNRGGTGLGLSACLEIIKQAGGKMRVDSVVGQGTTFTVSLPATRA